MKLDKTLAALRECIVAALDGFERAIKTGTAKNADRMASCVESLARSYHMLGGQNEDDYEPSEDTNASLRAERLEAARRLGTHTEAEWEAVLNQYGHACLCCGADDEPLTKDHIVPISKGGSDAIGNLQPLCLPCNSSKHTDTVDYRPPTDTHTAPSEQPA